MSETPADRPLFDRTRLLRDLDWAWSSPSLIQGPGWFDTRTLRPPAPEGTDTGPLHRWLTPGNRRLGHYFEDLLAFTLDRHPDYRLIARNLPVRDPEGQTLGELDFLLENRRLAIYEHWEVALKFYLGETDGLWYGPRRSDRLDLKLAHMCTRQASLAQTREGRSTLAELGLDWVVDRLLMKGRLFYPVATPPLPPPSAATPDHLRGFWCHRSGFVESAPRALRWRMLARGEWLSPASPDGTEISARELAAYTFNEPALVAGFQDGEEQRRGFLIPDAPPSAPPEETR